jgi:hypothetical protein
VSVVDVDSVDAVEGALMLPMPFIVGAARSGTTLLRMMLDAHPKLTIPPETGFVAAIAMACEARPRMSCDDIYRGVTEFPVGESAWLDFGLSKGAYLHKLQSQAEFSAANGVRAFYQLYAERFNKPRYGDKTPGYCLHLSRIQRLLPEAAFIHIIRDGRDAALSLRPLWFSPGSDMTTLARVWRSHVELAQADSTSCQRYLEVRYEHLLTQTEATLRLICEFIELDFDPLMLSYFKNAATRLSEHRARVRDDGRVLVSQQHRIQQQWRTALPPDPLRIGVWRTELTTAEREQFEQEAGRTLKALGYEIL